MRRFHIKVASAVVVAGGALTVSPLLAAAANSSSGPASISVAAVSATGGGQASPRLGSTVWYAEHYSNTTKNPVIDSSCYQNGTIVWSEVDSVTYANQYGVKMGGDSSPWLDTGGSANCTSTLESRVFKPSGETITNLASTSFVAAG